jgi:hypothetical protein
MPKLYLPKVYERDNDKIIEFINTGKKKPRGRAYPLTHLEHAEAFANIAIGERF